MKHYYIPADNERGFAEVTETEWNALLGDASVRPYAVKVYRGELTIGEVPEALQAAVAAVVEAKTARWGSWAAQPIPADELRTLTRALPRTELTRSVAKALLEDFRKLRAGADDALASTAVYAYPQLSGDGTLIAGGTRINWKGTIKRAAADLWDTAQNDPDHAPALWEDIGYRGGCRIIPETITVGTAFALGECGWWGDTLYRSKLDANVHTPVQHPDGWEVAA